VRNGTYASELRAELERAVRNYRSRTKWYAAGAAAAVAAAVVVVAVVAGSGHPSGSGTAGAAAANARPGATTSPIGDVVGDLGDVHIGDPTDSLTATQDRAGFRVAVPNSPEANAKDLTGTYVAPGEAVEMIFPPPDDASKQLRPPYISVTEFPWDGEDAAVAIERDLETAAELGLKQESACSVGNLPAVCVTAADPASASDTSGGYPNAAYVRFFRGNLEIHIAGGTSVDSLIKIGESMSS
jgi:hypothetical protein